MRAGETQGVWRGESKRHLVARKLVKMKEPMSFFVNEQPREARLGLVGS